jgi:pilus assembly protein FimV
MKSSALKQLTAAVASAMVLMSSVHAAGLGKLTVLSALGQPLRAEIELTSVSPEEAAGLAAKLASPDAFRTANIEFNPALLSLRFNVEQRGGRQFIRVTSNQPLNEPFVDMLLELSWNNGRLVREYTFLLDPAELRNTQSAQVATLESRAPAARPRADAPAQAGAQSSAQSSDTAALEPAERARRSRSRAAADEGDVHSPTARDAGPSRYRVKPGDSLSRIAGQLKPVDVSLDMMLVALYRANPDAFAGNNMNRLKSGRILSVPGSDAVHAIGEDDAHGTVVAHAADFNAYRNKLAGQVGASEPVKAAPAGQSAGGKITAKVEERPTAANESQDQLRLSKAAPNTPAGKGATASTEDRIAKQKELEDAQARTKELERNISDLEKIATVKSKEGAEAQDKAAAPVAPAQPEAAKPDAAPAKPAPKKLPSIKPAPAATPAAAQEPGIMGFIMDNLTVLGGVAIAALLGALLVAQRRKKKDVKAVAEPSILNVPTEPAHSLFAETGGQSVDTNNSVFNSSFAPSASQLDTNEVDPVAEADVYIAYGRDAQAEEILKEALRTHPERHPVRLKLLEIYAARKDTRAFETQAGELYSLTRGQGDEWAQAAALGHSIDPANPLYATNSVHAFDAAPAAPVAAAAAAAAGAAHDPHSHDLDDAFAAAASEEAARAPMSFDQHFADAMGTAQPSPQPAAEPAHDDHTLDFDLGGLSFEPVSAAPAAQSPVDSPLASPLESRDAREIAAANDVPDLEFDMSAFDLTPATATPAAAVAPTVDPAPAKREDEPLDFSFDMDFAPAANPVPQPAPAAVETPAHALDDLAFDHDLAFETPATGEHSAAAAPNTDIDMASLAREFDLPDLPTELHEGIPAAPEQVSPATELKDPLSDLDAMDFGLADEAPLPAATTTSAPLEASLPSIPHLSLDDDPFALPELPVATPAPLADAPYAEHELIEPTRLDTHFDLPGFDLDLPGEGALPLPEVHEDLGDGGAAVAAPASAPASALAGGPPAEMTAQQMEMETKLDLAIAYQEIGDKEGARELLEEVIRGGNPEQAARANAMRASLA